MGQKADPPSRPLAPAASPAELADDAAHGLMRRMPSLSAHRVVTTGQSIAFTFIAAALIAFSIRWPRGAWDLLVALTACAFVGGTLFRAALAFIGGLPLRGDAPAAGDLPLYTVLVPLYREANVLPRLARALLLLDYPDMLAQTPQAHRL